MFANLDLSIFKYIYDSIKRCVDQAKMMEGS